jgi:hypothetical protein
VSENTRAKGATVTTDVPRTEVGRSVRAHEDHPRGANLSPVRADGDPPVSCAAGAPCT